MSNSLREIYLRPFEMAVKEGGSSAMMSSFNRIGTVWAGGSYELLTDILRGEWGFRGRWSRTTTPTPICTRTR